jgi:hypothetical protein
MLADSSQVPHCGPENDGGNSHLRLSAALRLSRKMLICGLSGMLKTAAAPAVQTDRERRLF